MNILAGAVPLNMTLSQMASFCGSGIFNSNGYSISTCNVHVDNRKVFRVDRQQKQAIERNKKLMGKNYYD